jgi:hypothetical protein
MGITKTTIFDGQRHFIQRVDLLATSTGALTATNAGNPIVDVSALAARSFGRGACTSVDLVEICGTGPNFPCRLMWDANTDVQAMILGEGQIEQCFEHTGPLHNPMTASGATGDVHLIASSGIATGEAGSWTLTWRKRYG